MSDPLLDLYRQREAKATSEKNESARLAKEERDVRANGLIVGVPQKLDRMFDRLKATDYADTRIKARIRTVTDASGATGEKVTWCVGRSDSRWYTQEDQVSDSLYVCHDRTFCKVVPVGMYANEGDPGVAIDLSDLTLEELERVIQGIDAIGTPVPAR